MPSPWSRLVGHAPQKALWLSMRRSGRLPHALLLAGAEGIGKRLWALAAAEDLLCLDPGENGPCGTCASCNALAHEGAHPDLKESAPAEGHRDLRVEEAQDILDWLALPPIPPRRKVLILDQAEAVTAPTAPTLLKALEEPPQGTHLFLVSARPGAVLGTLVSRCRRIAFAPLPRDEFRKAVPDAGPLVAETLYRIGRGSPGEARRLKDSGILDLREGLNALAGAPHAQAITLAEKHLIPVKAAKKESEDGPSPSELRRQEAAERLELLASLLRDRLPGLPAEARLHPDLPPTKPWDGAPGGIREVAKALDTLTANVDLPLTLECCALALAAPPAR